MNTSCRQILPHKEKPKFTVRRRELRKFHIHPHPVFVATDSFDEEPYQIYEDLVMTVLGISHVAAENGAPDTIVVGALKRLTFTGGGAVEAGDQAVWVSGGRIDSDCTVAVFLSGPQSTVDSLNGADFLIPDEDGEDKAGQTWTLCYRFG